MSSGGYRFGLELRRVQNAPWPIKSVASPCSSLSLTVACSTKHIFSYPEVSTESPYYTCFETWDVGSLVEQTEAVGVVLKRH